MLTERITSLACTGGRSFDDWLYIYAVLDRLETLRGPIEILAHGKCPPRRGKKSSCDLICGAWGKENGKRVYEYPAKWGVIINPHLAKRHPATGTLYDPSAGPRRNRKMLVDRKSNALLHFPGGKGTADCILAAAELASIGLKIEVINARELIPLRI